MSDLIACPFCRQLFELGEAAACPDCGLSLKEIHKLPPSYDASVEDPEIPIPPHMEQLPWTFAGRSRALLLVTACLGLAAFFVPWVHESAPELRTLTGYQLACIQALFWAPAVAWFVAIPLVFTRRSVHKMRGARVAVGFLSAIALITVGLIFFRSPPSSAHRVVRLHWAWGLYASGALALVGVLAALRFGGRLDDLPTRQRRRPDEILH